MNTYAIVDIPEETHFSDDVYLDDTFLVLTPAGLFDEALKSRLQEWDFTTVHTGGQLLSSETTLECPLPASGDPNAKGAPGSEALRAQRSRFHALKKQYNEFQMFVEHVFDQYRAKQSLNTRAVIDRAKMLCELVKKHRQTLLRVLPTIPYREHYALETHALRSTLYAVVIGLQLKMQPFKIIELATSCLLHEIGMARVIPKAYTTEGELDPKTQKSIFAHPIISYHILRDHSLPLPVCVGALEHRERENGLGYPRRLVGEKISLYGKIIAVACSYEAATAPRSYKEMKNAAEGIVDLVRNANTQYDAVISRALLFALSFYPIGTHVHLSNGKIAQVVDVNPDDPRFPIVQVHGEIHRNGKPIIHSTSADEIFITRALSVKEQRLILQEGGD
ncbi:HD-GYP domain-containing protein [Treponema pallidum]|uniref:HD-GYP domain protein n=1 Tax=Treponema pallidum subsp. endemicum str. Bosnia A TaxID=1155776 RepID=A0AAU8RQR1_TREPL|nr:HD-GYP domain-containing protein [Treponema pallidum]AJB40787.1 HD-GYP domain protein [Treponema pallidum subsp. endemicum str. Bosnia A]QBC41805.1 HD-GYP domain protein [Treponema pallidum subsp. endemicum]QUL04790.1 HD-GYP domain-containing protein [Treponema pallidum]QUL24090.1 HD-GYP domain-containing protein [Treponema pallidum]QUL26985.1 HD-GYP domain-containing protein [Treponema pallidum]